MKLSTVCTVLLLNSVCTTVFSANILVMVPCPARSHFAMFEPLLYELTKRGHKLWVVSNFPQENGTAPPNYIDIDVSGTIPTFHNNVSVTDLVLFTDHYLSLYYNFLDLFEDVKASAQLLETNEMKQLLNTNVKFDLVLAELFSSDMFLGFAYKFKAPLISIVSSISLPWSNDRINNIENPSYTTHIFSLHAGEMNFKQRLVNTMNLVLAKLLYVYFNCYAEKVARKFFGDDLPPLSSLAMNTSMIFVNSFPAVNGVRPNIPQVIEIGGIHVKPDKRLPQDLEKFINESQHGVVYFSMGSMVKLSTLPQDQQLVFRTVLSRLPQRVLWKWEDDIMVDQPANVKIAKWLPQRDILAHPNVKLFITHGGLMGLTESIYSGVPIVGIPLFADQPANLAAVEAAGIGLQVSYHNITMESIGYAVNTVLNDPKYSENVRRLAELYRDRPMSPLDTAVYWTEYVIRHKGALHLQSPAAHLAWYQYWLLDVAAVVSATLLVFTFVFYHTIRYTFVLIMYNVRKTMSKKIKKA